MTTARAYAIAAGISWFALTLSFTLMLFNVYPPTEVFPYSYGTNPSGLAGTLGRVFDWFSYFTILSNILVAIVVTMLARNPDRGGRVWAALRMDSLVMISVTGVVYAIVLAPAVTLQGLQYVTNTLDHYVIPLLTVIMFLVIGPRRQVNALSILTALIIPIAWAIFILIRGAFIDAYPYGFINVIDLGLGMVIVNIIGVAVFGIVLGLIFWGADRLLSRRVAAAH